MSTKNAKKSEKNNQGVNPSLGDHRLEIADLRVSRRTTNGGPNLARKFFRNNFLSSFFEPCIFHKYITFSIQITSHCNVKVSLPNSCLSKDYLVKIQEKQIVSNCSRIFKVFSPSNI